MQKKIVKMNTLKVKETNPIIVDRAELSYEIEKFLRYQKRYSEKTIKNLMSRVQRIIDYYGVSIPTIDDAIRIEEEQRRLGNNDTTVTHYLKALKLIAEYQGVSLKIKLPKPVKREHLELSPPECNALISACLNLRDKCILSMLIYLGLRNKELRSLRLPSDLDLKNGFVYIMDHGQGIKSRVERKATIPKDCCRIIEQYLAARESMKVDTDYMFFAETGLPLSDHRLQIIVKEVAKRSGIGKRITPHGLRHVCAALMLKYAKVPVTEVSLQLGHKDVSTTVDWYLCGNYNSLKNSYDGFKL